MAKLAPAAMAAEPHSHRCSGCGARCPGSPGDRLYALGEHLRASPSCFEAFSLEERQVFLDALWDESATEAEYQASLAEKGWASPD